MSPISSIEHALQLIKYIHAQDLEALPPFLDEFIELKEAQKPYKVHAQILPKEEVVRKLFAAFTEPVNSITRLAQSSDAPGKVSLHLTYASNGKTLCTKAITLQFKERIVTKIYICN